PAGSTTYSAKLGIGGGLLFAFPMGAKMGLEVGALYAGRKSEVTSSGTTAEVCSTGIEVPVLLRFKLGNVVSLGVGGYVHQAMGKLKIKASGVEVESSYSDFGLKSREYGAAASLGFEFPMGKNALVVDGRYLLGLNDLSHSSADTTK